MKWSERGNVNSVLHRLCPSARVMFSGRALEIVAEWRHLLQVFRWDTFLWNAGHNPEDCNSHFTAEKTSFYSINFLDVGPWQTITSGKRDWVSCCVTEIDILSQDERERYRRGSANVSHWCAAVQRWRENRNRTVKSWICPEKKIPKPIF
jgi:hypothetical protein